jgi:aldehyde dehydrogenase (NAD+)
VLRRRIAPTLLLDVPLDSAMMKEEIFGPLLPIITVRKNGEREKKCHVVRSP